MKSVGEVMGIGRNFTEALQKACQSLENGKVGLGADGKNWTKTQDILDSLNHPSWDRIFKIKDAMELGVPIHTIQKLTQIDIWFLYQIQDLVKLEKEIKRFTINNIPKELLLLAKTKGFSDLQLAYLLGRIEEDEVYNHRKSLGIKRVYKMVDTCAAEFESKTNYFYSTFSTENESIVSDKKKIIVLGSGPNRIGQGIEFDYCCVHGILALKESGYEAIMINCNPETVSTDFDIANKLYFEPVFWENLREIIEHEKPEGVIVQLGGQTALKLAQNLHKNGVKIIGTSYNNMDIAEDRGRFSNLLKELNIPYPEYGVCESAEEALEVVKGVGYPVLVRPSYVIGGQKMRIVINNDELERAVIDLLKSLPDNKILIDHFLDRASEAEIDAIYDGESVRIMGVMEHVEPAGIHSGDSNALLPPFSLGEVIIQTMKNYAIELCKALEVKGLLNIQFAIKGDKVYVIEANPRASRTTPFICKAYKIPYLNIATKVMIGHKKLSDFTFVEQLSGFAIKEPVFSFDKFPNVNKELGPEMKSTGEAIRYIKDLNDPYFRDLYRLKSMYLSR
jgi:carbamoyl-phosphate synthase large subunit